MTRQQLIDAVLADPVADEPRLAFASWLEGQARARVTTTNGQVIENPRARLIRIQCELSHLTPTITDHLKQEWPCERHGLLWTQQRNLITHLSRVPGVFAEFPADLVTDVVATRIPSAGSTFPLLRIDRGFISEYAGAYELLVAHGDWLSANHPIRTVVLYSGAALAFENKLVRMRGVMGTESAAAESDDWKDFVADCRRRWPGVMEWL